MFFFQTPLRFKMYILRIIKIPVGIGIIFLIAGSFEYLTGNVIEYSFLTKANLSKAHGYSLIAKTHKKNPQQHQLVRLGFSPPPPPLLESKTNNPPSTILGRYLYIEVIHHIVLRLTHYPVINSGLLLKTSVLLSQTQ